MRANALDARLEQYINRLDEKLKVKFKKNRLYFYVSEDLCVYYGQRGYTLNFLSNIAYTIWELKQKVHIDLSKCSKISASALVMLFAEVSRARMGKEDDDVITLTMSDTFKDPKWKEAIELGHRQYSRLFDEDHTFQTVSDPNKALASILKLMHNCGVKLARPESKIFTKGINEAMLNVINHAYDDQEDPLGGIGRRWWQACWLQPTGGGKYSLVYIIYDLGCGMLNSLPKASEQETIAEHITRAMAHGTTRTGIPGRGKGTKNMEDAAEIRAKSTLFVGTNSVSYCKVEGKDAIVEPCLLPFNGTLVEWQICI